MAILIDSNTRVLVQGITGKTGAFHAEKCLEYGTKVVAGVTPGKGGQKFQNTVPIFHTVKDAVRETQANASLIFVPPPFAADAILEAVDGGVLAVVVGFDELIARGAELGAKLARGLVTIGGVDRHRAGTAQQRGVPVGRSLGDHVGANHTTGTGAIVDHH